MLTGPVVILTLKVAVAAVTVLLAAALTALALGRVRLHGWINTAFAALTLTAVLGLEVLIRLIDPHVFDALYAAHPDMRQAMRVHLAFSIPSAVLIPVMFFSGRSRRRSLHVALGVAFLVLWAGTFTTGLFYLPHTLPGAGA